MVCAQDAPEVSNKGLFLTRCWNPTGLPQCRKGGVAALHCFAASRTCGKMLGFRGRYFSMATADLVPRDSCCSWGCWSSCKAPTGMVSSVTALWWTLVFHVSKGRQRQVQPELMQLLPFTALQ